MSSSKLYDVSLLIHPDLPVWPGDPQPVFEKSEMLVEGSTVVSGRAHLSLHLGTHIDAPAHLNPSGWTIDQIPPEILIGEVQVIQVQGVQKITADILKNMEISNAKRYFFKTDNSKFWRESPLRFHEEYCSFAADAGKYLSELGAQLIGIDYLSLDLYEASGLPVHHILTSQNIVGVEGLDLSGITPGIYEGICLPLRIVDGDGSPARVVLRKN